MASFGVVCVAVSVFVCLCLANATTVRPCRVMSSEKPISINIYDCQEPGCMLKKGSNATVEIKFQTSEEIPTLEATVVANIFGLPFPIKGLDEKDACKDVHVDGNPAKMGCPLEPGVVYMYENTFPIQSYYPNVKAILHCSLLNGPRNIVCFEVTVKITD